MTPDTIDRAPTPMRACTDGTQVWTDDGQRFYISARDLKSVHPDRPTVRQVRLETQRSRFKGGVHFMRTHDGLAVFTDIGFNVGIGPRPSRGVSIGGQLEREMGYRAVYTFK